MQTLRRGVVVAAAAVTLGACRELSAPFSESAYPADYVALDGIWSHTLTDIVHADDPAQRCHAGGTRLHLRVEGDRVVGEVNGGRDDPIGVEQLRDLFADGRRDFPGWMLCLGADTFALTTASRFDVVGTVRGDSVWLEASVDDSRIVYRAARRGDRLEGVVELGSGRIRRVGRLIAVKEQP
jgi:hypothetical protein